MEDTMKALLSTAGALALIATSAAANPPTGTPAAFNNTQGPNGSAKTVTLFAEVFDYVAVWGEEDSAVLNVADVTTDSNTSGNNNDTNDARTDKALFTVTSNVTHDITLEWETWGDVNLSNPTNDFDQANYYNSAAECSIGGTIKLDPNPAPEFYNDAISGGGTGTMTHEDAAPTWAHEYGIGTEASPVHTNCPGDIAAPGTYSLDVDITVSKAGA
ncbi:hypothetical protein DRV84_03950 [Rhodosalinus sediminis]|uniref:PEP-CTERM sorting domain-containing protein n=1 Tax=Rhodosalinus sediminis TaxID=1940533 RepID=A0A3D9BXD3_9RHOB|nr:hypothetical protein [Rhodosalinus sediminis]REC58193.1 hypothetical protein DRV84_03950 [Rhodosalinus sediminis]